MTYIPNLNWNIIKGLANESWFIHYYLGECHGNGVQAYLKVHPRAKYQSAKASASRLLKKTSVAYMLNLRLEKMGGGDKK